MRPIWLSLVILPLLAACADDTATNPVARPAPAQKIPPQDFAPGLATEEPAPAGRTLVNDPSAPLTTPLCGSALREANQVGATLYPQPARTPSSCPQNACFDPLTGTFIAADGNRSVCR